MTPPWYDILKSTGWPTAVVVLDFETYFDPIYSLKKLSTIEYVMDPRFEEHGLAVLMMDTPGVPIEPHFWHYQPGMFKYLQDKYGTDLERCTVVWHNGRFDGTVLTRHHGISPRYAVDIRDLADQLNPRRSNSVEALAERYGLQAKGDTMQFSGLHWDRTITTGDLGMPTVKRGMTDAEKEAMCVYACNDAEIEWGLFTVLLPKISRPSFEMPLMLHTHRLFWHPKIAFDSVAADSLIVDMEAKIDEVATKVGHTRKELSGDISFVKILQAALPEGEKVPFKQGKKKLIPALAKTDPGLLLLKEHPDGNVRNLIAARQAVGSWPLHIARVGRMQTQSQASGDGRLPVPLLYCGAHTWRWSGGELINLQNLSARSLEALILRIRGLLVPPEGFSFVVADAAQVEARATAWIAGQWDLVEMFAAGAQIYCQFASEVLGKKIRKPFPDDPPPLVKYMKHWRAFGKVGVLGCGYGMGWERCMEFARNVYHIDITPSMARQLVNHYRDKYQKICRFWRDVEKAFKYVTRYPGQECDLPRGLHFRNEDDCTFITLPSGRELRYEEARVVGSGRDETLKYPNQREHTWIYMWGGFLTENVIQALCRDLFAEAMMDLEDQGVPTGLHVHDELIAVVPTEDAPQVVDQAIAAFRKRPEWAPDLPLDAEAEIKERYGK